MSASANSTSSTENSGSPRRCSSAWPKKAKASPTSTTKPAPPPDRSECRNRGEADHAPSHLLRGRKIQSLSRLQKRFGAKATKMKREAVIVDAVRTPLGRRDGILKAWHPV